VSMIYVDSRKKAPENRLSHLQNDLFAQTLRYARNFILGISIICLW
jgi:hypothetical protein